jgi:hypothetical protein
VAGEIFLLAVAAAVAEGGLCVPDGVIFAQFCASQGTKLFKKKLVYKSFG